MASKAVHILYSIEHSFESRNDLTLEQKQAVEVTPRRAVVLKGLALRGGESWPGGWL